ncbi:hypothetical protein O3P69_005840 [Scylla paramamosain]|uniref:Uncharacterized protein n=1 Tax=Scylla paramamosain TaxID=85552 RepID=A0AAW0U3K3_SCYPA
MMRCVLGVIASRPSTCVSCRGLRPSCSDSSGGAIFIIICTSHKFRVGVVEHDNHFSGVISTFPKPSARLGRDELGPQNAAPGKEEPPGIHVHLEIGFGHKHKSEMEKTCGGDSVAVTDFLRRPVTNNTRIFPEVFTLLLLGSFLLRLLHVILADIDYWSRAATRTWARRGTTFWAFRGHSRACPRRSRTAGLRRQGDLLFWLTAPRLAHTPAVWACGRDGEREGHYMALSRRGHPCPEVFRDCGALREGRLREG